MAFIRRRQYARRLADADGVSYQLVESYRADGKVRQRILANLGTYPTVAEALGAVLAHANLQAHRAEQPLGRYPNGRPRTEIDRCEDLQRRNADLARARLLASFLSPADRGLAEAALARSIAIFEKYFGAVVVRYGVADVEPGRGGIATPKPEPRENAITPELHRGSPLGAEAGTVIPPKPGD